MGPFRTNVLRKMIGPVRVCGGVEQALLCLTRRAGGNDIERPMMRVEAIADIQSYAAGDGASRGKIVLCALCCALVALAATYASANISVTASVDRNEVRLGERFGLVVSVAHDPGYKLSEPKVGKTLGDFVVVNRSKHEAKGNPPTTEFRYTIAGFKLDRATIATVAVQYTDPQGRPGELETHPIGVRMLGTVPAGQTEIKDIRGMVEIEPRMALWLKILIGLVAGVLACVITWWLVKRRRKQQLEKPAPKPLPASVVALAELDKLAKSDLLFLKQYKEFYFRLSEIIRRFLSGRLNFPADDMTTTEIEFMMRDDPISPEFTAAIFEILNFSDMVKFAKLIPSDPKNDEIIEKARRAIELGQEPLFGPNAESAPQAETSGHDFKGIEASSAQ